MGADPLLERRLHNILQQPDSWVHEAQWEIDMCAPILNMRTSVL